MSEMKDILNLCDFRSHKHRSNLYLTELKFLMESPVVGLESNQKLGFLSILQR